MDVNQLTADALALSEDDRVVLVERLMDSLAGQGGVDTEYREELDRRAQRLRDGTAKIRDWSEVESFVRQLKESRG